MQIAVTTVLSLSIASYSFFSKAERQDIERVQKTAIHIMLGDGYKNYSDALEFVGLEIHLHIIPELPQAVLSLVLFDASCFVSYHLGK